jgi:hypothetical protein
VEFASVGIALHADKAPQAMKDAARTKANGNSFIETLPQWMHGFAAVTA